MINAWILVFLLVQLVLLYIWSKYKCMCNYWKCRGIPYEPPLPIIGNTKEALTIKNSFGLHLSDIYNYPHNSNEPVVGIFIFNQPALIIREPDIIKSILVKEFDNFTNHYAQVDPHSDKLARYNLFFARDALWKKLRTKISPSLTSNRMKYMYPLMVKVGKDLENDLVAKGGSFVENVKNMCAMFALDIIASTTCGISPNSLKNPEGEFSKQCRSIFLPTLTRSIDFSVTFFLPKLSALLKTQFFPKAFCNFIQKTILFVMHERERSQVERNDLIDTLLKLKNEAQTSGNGTDIFQNMDCVVAQSATFIAAGFETSSSLISFTLFELAKNKQIQQKLRQEICEALVAGNGELTYERIQSLAYLNMVLDETLRLYPVLPFLDRYHSVNGKSQGFTLQPYHDFSLPDGMPIYVPVFALHRDPKYWENPDKYDPERFSTENKQHHTPMTYMPFGIGPRFCIGQRIGVLQARVGLVHLLKNHHVTVCDKTLLEPKFDPRATVLQFKGGVYLQLNNDNMFNNATVQQCA